MAPTPNQGHTLHGLTLLQSLILLASAIISTTVLARALLVMLFAAKPAPHGDNAAQSQYQPQPTAPEKPRFSGYFAPTPQI